MAIKRVQHVRHITTDADLFTGLIGEFTMDVTRNDLRIHDGVTPGGWRIMNKVAMDAAYLPRNDNAIIINDVKVHANPGNQTTRDFIVGANGFANALKVTGLTGVVSMDKNFTVATAGSQFNQADLADLTIFQSTEPGAAVGPTIAFDRASASPAAADNIGRLAFRGRSSIAASINYSSIRGAITDPNTGTEDGELHFYSMVAGADGSRVKIGAGLYTTGAAGGDKGVDTINATNLYEANVLLTTKYGQIAVANTWTALNVFSTAGSAPLIMQWIDAGAAFGPILNLERVSASPAVNDGIGQLKFAGRDDGGNFQEYASIAAAILDPVNTSEDGSIQFSTAVAGTPTTRFVIAQGMYSLNATGFDKGLDTINVKNLFIDGGALGRLVGVQIFQAAGVSVYTPTALAINYEAELVGGGGGGGGCATTGAAQIACGIPGGAGAYVRKRGLISAISGANVTVGAKGTGGAAGNNAGTAGGTSSIGAVVSALGGGLGSGGAAVAVPVVINSAAGGVASGGDLNIDGGSGQQVAVSLSTIIQTGAGGVAPIYGGLTRSQATVTGAAGLPAPTNGFGSGGSGGCNIASQGTARAGGDGEIGLVIIREYA